VSTDNGECHHFYSTCIPHTADHVEVVSLRESYAANQTFVSIILPHLVVKSTNAVFAGAWIEGKAASNYLADVRQNL
jgi:hypothetical protein